MGSECHPAKVLLLLLGLSSALGLLCIFFYTCGAKVMKRSSKLAQVKGQCRSKSVHQHVPVVEAGIKLWGESIVF